MAIDVFMPFAQMEEELQNIAREYPGLARLDSYGTSRCGRPLYMLTVTDFSTGPAEDKPAMLVHAHIHCHELAGTPAVLDFARKILREHKPDGILATTAFYMIPRINPDGAEHVILHSGYTRSRWKMDETRPNHYVQEDVSGKGGVGLCIRKETPYGNLAQDESDPRCMVPRTPFTKGPFYKTWNEGQFHNWDGHTTQLNGYEGIMVDMNRNWPSNWTPKQLGAGDYPACEPEVRHTLDFLVAHRNIFASVGFHNGYGGILYPPDGRASSELPPQDRERYQVLAAKAEELTGYPAYVSCEFTYSGRPLEYRQGSFDDCMYFLFGIYAFTIELGTRETSAGLTATEIFNSPTRKFDCYSAPREVCRFDDAHPQFRPAVHHWKKFHHPQFGEVEIGGGDTASFAVPDPDWLAQLYPKTSTFIEFLGQHRPHVEISETQVEELGSGIKRIRLTLFNHGALPTSVTQMGKELPLIKVPEVRFYPAEGCQCLSQKQHFEIGHLGSYEPRCLEWFVKCTHKVGKFQFLCGAGGNITLEL